MSRLRHIPQNIANGSVRALDLVEQALKNAQSAQGQGHKVFTKIHADQAREAARHIDAMAKVGATLPPLAGVVLSIKDLFDEAGIETLAGSVASKGEGPATADADVVRALKQNGAIIIGRTNMTEYAFSGLGLNPHYGTPLNPWDREVGRIPGGSSSGAAVSVADEMAMAGIGSDTGGSIRIPAALCGLTGFKPTARRISRTGVFPLSTSLDSIGPIAPSVDDCAFLDHIMQGNLTPYTPATPRPVKGSRFAVPTNIVLNNMDETVAVTFTKVLEHLSDAGAIIEDIHLAALDEIPALNTKGGFAGAEAFAFHRQRIASKSALYDPRVLVRMAKGSEQSAADYISLLHARDRLCAEAAKATAPYDALLLPTVPVVAPPLAVLESDDDFYGVQNLLMLRNPSFFNFLDRCAYSLPCHAHGTAPVGLMVVGQTMGDHALTAVASGLEAEIAKRRRMP